MKRRLFTRPAFASLASLAAVACLAPIAGGCGSLGDVEHREPLAVIQGQLTQAATAPATTPSNVRIAVVWMNIDGSGYRATQDVKATPVFPSSYRLELTDPPPREAMSTGEKQTTPSDPPTVPQEPPSSGTTPSPGADNVGTRSHVNNWPSGFAMAYGAVVAYEDRNGNGKLDLVDDGASSYVDRILGANEDLSLLYIEGTAPAEAKDKKGHMPVQGFNIYRGIGRSCEVDDATNSGSATLDDTIKPKSEGGPAIPCTEPEWLGMNTAYNLPLTADPKFSKIMCKSGGKTDTGSSLSGGVSTPTPGPGPNGKYPSATDPNLSCSADGKTYVYTVCTTYSEGLCKGDVLTCTSSTWSMPGTTKPEGWPCNLP